MKELLNKEYLEKLSKEERESLEIADKVTSVMGVVGILAMSIVLLCVSSEHLARVIFFCATLLIFWIYSEFIY